MAVAITAPASQLVRRSGGVAVAWEAEYPQNAYEFLYRRKGEDAWSTCGRVESGAQEMELDTSMFEDYVEYHFRVICYAQNAASDDGTIYTGSDSSPAYSLILVPDAKAKLKVQGEEGMVEVPIYEEAPRPSLRLGKVGAAPLTERDGPLATPVRVWTGEETLALAGAEARCTDAGVAGATDLSVSKRYYAPYSYTQPYRYSYSYASRYSYTYSDSYKYSYSKANSGTYYYYSYTSGTYTPYSTYSYRYSYQYTAYEAKSYYTPGSIRYYYGATSANHTVYVYYGNPTAGLFYRYQHYYTYMDVLPGGYSPPQSFIYYTTTLAADYSYAYGYYRYSGTYYYRTSGYRYYSYNTAEYGYQYQYHTGYGYRYPTAYGYRYQVGSGNSEGYYTYSLKK